MSKRVVSLLALAALALPAAAAAKTYDVSGRLGLLGRGDVSADLTAGADAKPVRIAVLGGSLTVTPVSSDVQVKRRTGPGGKAVLAVISGSHFQIQATGKLFLLGIPQGYTGSVDADTAKQCGLEINCRQVIQRLRARAHGGGNGNGNAGGNAGNTTGNGNGAAANAAAAGVTADPGTAESLAQLQAALAALGGGK
jgi:hypothetical protein